MTTTARSSIKGGRTSAAIAAIRCVSTAHPAPLRPRLPPGRRRSVLQAPGTDRPGRADRDDPRARGLSAPLAVEGDVHPLAHHLQHPAAPGRLRRGEDALGPVDVRGQLRRHLAQSVDRERSVGLEAPRFEAMVMTGVLCVAAAGIGATLGVGGRPGSRPGWNLPTPSRTSSGTSHRLASSSL